MNLITSLNKNDDYKLAIAYICRDLPYGQYCQGVPYPLTRDAYELLNYLFNESIKQNMDSEINKLNSIDASARSMANVEFNSINKYPWPVDQLEH